MPSQRISKFSDHLACYFLLNYASTDNARARESGQEAVLLFSFELCVYSLLGGVIGYGIYTCYFLLNYAYSYSSDDLVYAIVLTCYFLLNYALVWILELHLPHTLTHARSWLAIFFWIMLYLVGLIILVRNPRITCYFLLNYASQVFSCLIARLNALGAPLLLAIFFWIMPENIVKILTDDDTVTCYFLLNYARARDRLRQVRL